MIGFLFAVLVLAGCGREAITGNAALQKDLEGSANPNAECREYCEGLNPGYRYGVGMTEDDNAYCECIPPEE